MDTQSVKDNHIVVANGLGKSGRPIQRMLIAEGYRHVSYAAGGADAVSLCTHLLADLLLLDLQMDDIDGLGVIERLAPVLRRGRLQIIVVTRERNTDARHRALDLGARDFILEPIDPTELHLRVRNALSTSSLESALMNRSEELADAVKSQFRQLTRARGEILRHLAIAAEFNDYDAGDHTGRVGLTSATLADAYGLPPDQVEMIAVAAPLHDVGKIGVPDSILLKPGPLSESERELMRTHTTIGAAILAGSEVPVLHMAEAIALCHHERCDGAGYPYGLTRTAIPIFARIVAIADVFDALTHARPYKPAWTVQDAVAEIRAQAGKQFDPQLVERFMRLDHARLVDTVAPRERSDRVRTLRQCASFLTVGGADASPHAAPCAIRGRLSAALTNGRRPLGLLATP